MKERESNIEILRILSMLLIVLVHSNYFSLGLPTQAETLTSPLASFWRVLAEQICTVGVNLFIMISGWFSIKPSIKGFCSLIYQILFWGLALLLIGFALHVKLPIKSIVQLFWFGGWYWFIPEYIGLYMISPVLNAFADRASPKQFISVLVCFFGIEIIYGWFWDLGKFSSGYSMVSFCGLYLLARFLRIHHHRLKSIKTVHYLLTYCITTLVAAVLSFVEYRNGWKQIPLAISYLSPLVILAAASLFLCFTKIQFKNKAVNWIAISTFSVYLVHQHPVVVPYFKSVLNSLWEQLNPIAYSGVVFLMALVLLLVCAVSDKIRIKSWEFLYNTLLGRIISCVEKAYNNVLGKISMKFR